MGDLSTIHCITEPNGRSLYYPQIGDQLQSIVQQNVMGDPSTIHFTTEHNRIYISIIHCTTAPYGRSLAIHCSTKLNGRSLYCPLYYRT